MLAKKARRRQIIRFRIREKIRGTPQRPRLSVFRSNKEIYAQVIDDTSGHTLVAAFSREPSIATKKLTKVEKARLVGEEVGRRAKEAGIEQVVFDRGGYLYHGRVKALADGARSQGLKF